MKKLIAGCIIAAGMVLASPAGATSTVTFGFTTDPKVGISGEPGSLYPVKEIETPDDIVGHLCTVTVDVRNNESVRLGTNLIIRSEGTDLTLFNVEGVAGNAPPVNVGQFTPGWVITAWVQFGPEGVASVDADVHVQCDVPPPTTTVPPTPTTPTVTPPPVTPPVAAAVVIAPKFTG